MNKRLPDMLMLLAVSLLLFTTGAEATPEYSGNSGQSCKTCHIRAEGGALSETGLEFAASGYNWPPTGGYRVLGPIRKTARFFVGLFHITAGFMWFGTILYVHILLRPAYAAKGLPKGEMFLGVVSMAIVGITGTLLTVSRIKSLSVLWSSPWGMALSTKIAMYLVMISTAAFVIAYIRPRLGKSDPKLPVMPADGVFNTEMLAAFDGKEGRPAFVAVASRVYDVTAFRLWKGGRHMKHAAGEDMTDAITKAPHTVDKLENAAVVGSFDAASKPALTPAQKMFYVIAYLNLGLVFAVIFVLAILRWGI